MAERRTRRGAAARGRPGHGLGAVLRAAVGFAVGLGVWLAFAAPYEAVLARSAQTAIRAFESPAVTRLSASGGEIRVDRSDFPPSSPRPGLPGSDLDFNLVLLTSLFALGRHPLAPRPFGRFWIAAAALAVSHAAALVFQVEALYATNLGPWSEAHYGTFARNFWAAGFHFYLIAGRFAIPFALWWGLRDPEDPVPGTARRTQGRSRS